MAQQIFTPMNNVFVSQPQTPQPTKQPLSGRFTQQSANNQSENNEDPMEVLGKLKKLLDAGLIKQAEYNAKKTEILSRM